MVKVEAIFSDFDGTLCPLELRRQDAYIAPRLRRVLTKVGKRIRLGIVTTKDLSFVKERVPFAQGFAASSGLELQVGDRITVDERIKQDRKIEKTYQDALKKMLTIRNDIMVERKETEDGDLLAFCIDWRLTHDWDKAHKEATPILALCKEQGMCVIESQVSPFANVFPFQVDKGEALAKLRKEMQITGPLVYLGDSEADDPAFRLAEVSVGVKHQRVMPPLQCKYRLEFFQLENFLTDLMDSDFEFKDKMLQRNTPA